MAKKKDKKKAKKEAAKDDVLSILSPGDRKKLKTLLKSVEGHLWNVNTEDKRKALDDLKKHVVLKSQRFGLDNSMEVAIFSMGSPEVIAKGIRTLYGYGTGFKAFILVLVALVSIVSVPFLPSGNPIEGVYGIMAIVVVFFLVAHFGTRTGLVFGGTLGMTAAFSRGSMVLAMVFSMPADYAIGTLQAIIDFVLVCMFLVLVGLLAGHIRESSIKKYLEQAVPR
jgi:hypothetical protein